MWRFRYASMLLVLVVLVFGVTHPEYARQLLVLSTVMVVVSLWKSITLSWQVGNRLWVVSWSLGCMGLMAHVVLACYYARVYLSPDIFVAYWPMQLSFISKTCMLGIFTRMYCFWRMEEENGFVQSGPFALCAHPMYVLMLIGAAPAWTVSDWRLMIFGSVVWVLMFITMYCEEAKFLAEDGPLAKKYYRRVPSIHWFTLRWRGARSKV